MPLRPILILCVAVSLAAQQPSPERLRKDVTYLASDKLKGRAAGTPELERAAEYIARRFRSIGLQPASAMGYFQTVPVKADTDRSAALQIEAGAVRFTVGPETSVPYSIGALKFGSVPLVKVDRAYAKGATGQPLTGKAALVTESVPLSRLGTPALILYASEDLKKVAGKMPSVSLSLAFEQTAGQSGTTALFSTDPELIKWAAALPGGPVADATVSGTVRTTQRHFDIRNVVGVLPGSDPVLKNTYIVVSAHYDGLGEVSSGTDRIRNGATDNASGTATMIAVAEAISRRKERPKRSIVFAAWTGEEAGGIGSRFYAFLPSFPLARTVANINIEQPGRHDGEGGAGPKRMLVTGLTYSDVGRIVTEAAKKAGVEAYAAPNEFFSRSDNYFLARAGVPAHTVGASLEFPDYHAVTDSAEKLDYGNMAVLANAIAEAVLAIADTAQSPEWNASEGATAPYRKARAAELPAN